MQVQIGSRHLRRRRGADVGNRHAEAVDEACIAVDEVDSGAYRSNQKYSRVRIQLIEPAPVNFTPS